MENQLKINDRRIQETEVLDVSIPAQQDNSPASMMMAAIQQGIDLDKVQKAMELQERWEANEARKLFFEAVAAFKENPPEVLKDKTNSQFKSMYTSLGNLLKTVNPALGQHGLSVSFEINQDDKLITVSCKLSHRQGHSEKVTMTAPPDTSGGNSKNPIQQIKSTITYLRSATFEAVTGLAATDANLDDDGNGAGKQPEYITEHEKNQIVDMMNEIGMKEDRLLKSFKIDSIDHLLSSKFEEAMTALKDALTKKQEKANAHH